MPDKIKLSIVIPVYNEERYIDAILERVCAVRFQEGVELEYIAVDDCSTDGTWERLQAWEARGFKLKRHEVNGGKGSALHTGFALATGDVVTIQDADFEEFHEQFMARNLQRLLGDFFYGPHPRYKIDLWLAGHTHKSARYTPHDQKIVSFSKPGFHRLTDREKNLYPFPVVVLDGPGNIGPCQASGILVTVSPECIEVISRQPTGEVIDHIRIQPDNTVEVIETALQ